MPIDFPSNPVNGQTYANYIYDSSITAWRNLNTETGVAALNASGLKIVVPSSVTVGSGSATVNSNGLVTFNGVTSLSLNGVFTSIYSNYRIVISGNSSAHAQAASIRMRSGSDTSTNIYYFGGSYGPASGTGAAWQGSAANLIQWGNTGIESTTLSMDIYRPKLTERTGFSWQSHGYTGSTYAGIVASGMVYDQVSYDSCSILIGGGATISGNVQVYGYAN